MGQEKTFQAGPWNWEKNASQMQCNPPSFFVGAWFASSSAPPPLFRA